MKTKNPFENKVRTLCLIALAASLAGCATTDQNGPSAGTAASAGHFPVRYQATDGRIISIGKCFTAKDGWAFKEPHMDECWIANDFTFNGYDTLYIAPTLSTAKFQNDETHPHELAMQNLPLELKRELDAKGIFGKIVLSESEIPPSARVLKLENTITEYSKGGGAARYWVGLYGGGQPVLRVLGKITDGDKTVCAFNMRRSGVSGGARVLGAYMKDEDIQIEDIRSLALDFGDFAAAIAGKYPAKN